MNQDVRRLVFSRSRGKCECCGLPMSAGELDHFFGRAKAPETVETCWALRSSCHYAKTNNSPTKSTWLLKFIAHCGKYGFASAAARAQKDFEWVEQKKAFAS